MKLAILLLTVVLAVVGVKSAPQDDKYTTKYDNINIDEILQSERLLNNYVKCLLDKGPCTADATDFKKVLPDALASECIKCNDKQKDNAKIVIHFIIQKKPEVWKEMEKKYDPDGSYHKKYLRYKDQLTPEERKNLGIE